MLIWHCFDSFTPHFNLGIFRQPGGSRTPCSPRRICLFKRFITYLNMGLFYFNYPFLCPIYTIFLAPKTRRLTQNYSIFHYPRSFSPPFHILLHTLSTHSLSLDLSPIGLLHGLSAEVFTRFLSIINGISRFFSRFCSLRRDF